MASYQETARNIMDAVGGSSNVQSVTHCMTRLRFVLNDFDIPHDDEVKKINGVLGVARSGGQYQVIIGTTVPKVYDEVLKLGSFGTAAPAEPEKKENETKEKLTPKEIGKQIIGYMASCMTPMIPVMLAGGLFSSINAIFGPGMLNLYTVESNLYQLFQMLYHAAYYFMPILIGMNGAKKLNVNTMLGAYVGCILIAPEFMAMVGQEGASFTVFGLPCMLNDYSQTAIPAMLCVFAMSMIYKGLKKVIPDILATVFTPFLTMLITTPIALCLLAPLGSIVGSLISGGLAAFGQHTGFVGVAVIAGVWEFLVMGGMHMALMMPMLASYFETGVMSGPLVSGNFATWACFGVALGAALRLKNREEKSTSFGFFVSGILGGITEPTLYGICLQHTRCFIGMVVGGFLGGAYAGIVDLKGYLITSPNFLSILSYTGGSTANLVNGVIGSVIALVAATVVTYFFGFTNKELQQ